MMAGPSSGGKVVRERFHNLTSGDNQIDRLRMYLGDWQSWEDRYKMDLGVPNSVPWARYMKSYMPGGDNEADGRQTINTEAMRILDGAMTELRTTHPDEDIAIRWRYLNVSVGAYVFRLRGQAAMSMMELDALADAGERALLPVARRRGLEL